MKTVLPGYSCVLPHGYSCVLPHGAIHVVLPQGYSCSTASGLDLCWLHGDLALPFMVHGQCSVCCFSCPSWNFDSCFERCVCVFIVTGVVVLEHDYTGYCRLEHI